MSIADILTNLKIDLGITTTAYDDRLSQYINAAIIEITREGATVTATVDGETTVNPDDAHLVTDYAAWMWRKRDSMEGMPRMVRYALNNRVLQEKIKEA